MAVENINPEKEPIPASWVPRVITGGKEPPDGGPTDIWLDRLPTGAVFVTNRQGDFKAYLHEILWHGEHYTLLKVTFPDTTTQELYVENVQFCYSHPGYEFLGIQEAPTKETNHEYDPNSNRSD